MSELRKALRYALYDAFEAGWFDNHGSIADAWEDRAPEVMERPKVRAVLALLDEREPSMADEAETYRKGWQAGHASALEESEPVGEANGEAGSVETDEYGEAVFQHFVAQAGPYPEGTPVLIMDEREARLLRARLASPTPTEPPFRCPKCGGRTWVERYGIRYCREIGCDGHEHDPRHPLTEDEG